MCGSFLLPWDNLRWTAQQLLRLSKLPRIFFSVPCTGADAVGPVLVNAIHRARKDLHNLEQVPPLTLLLRHRSGQVTDDRDRVYALFGLSPREFTRLRLRPRYEISVPTLYYLVARAIIRCERNLTILSIPRVAMNECVNEDKDKTNPSWVPDWSQQPHAKTLLELEEDTRSGGRKRHSAAGRDDYIWRAPPQDSARALRVQGFIVDTIEHLVRVELLQAPSQPSPNSWWKFARDYASWLRARESSSRSVEQVLNTTSSNLYLTGHTMMIVSREVLCAGIREEGVDDAYARQRRSHHVTGRLFDWSHIIPLHAVMACVHLVGMALERWLAFDKPWSTAAMTPDFSTYDRSPMRTVFRTCDNYMGLGPTDAVEGDKIVLCRGCEMPIVLRKAQRNWTLLGDSFVFGMMRGERWRPERCEDLLIE